MRCSPFTTCDKPLRSIYDTASNGYWFSVIDLCAIPNLSQPESQWINMSRGAN